MKSNAFPLSVVVAACTLLGTNRVFSEPTVEPAALRANALKILAPLPDKMPGAENDSAALTRLGKKLYFEKRLSQNESQSCNTCHAVDKGRAGVDNEPTSEGAFGKRGGRNSPTTLNAGFHFAQFWDGRAADLKEQAKGPVLNPVEMAMPSEAVVIERLKKDKDYPREFAVAFPGQDEPLTYDNVASAIAAFERTLITRDRLDDFMKGDDKALTAVEAKGLHTFLTLGCTACHNGALLGGKAYQKIGLIKPYANQNDIGRAMVTKDDADKFKFKVPSLRNVAATGPYFHDGSMVSLEETVRTMASLQLGLELSKQQEQELVNFLQCLTGKDIASAAPGEAASRSTE